MVSLFWQSKFISLMRELLNVDSTRAREGLLRVHTEKFARRKYIVYESLSRTFFFWLGKPLRPQGGASMFNLRKVVRILGVRIRCFALENA